MKIKKALSAVFSVALCVCMVLSVVLPMFLCATPTAHATEPYTLRIEAENAYWNGYQVVKASSISADYTVIGNASTSCTYATWNELSSMRLNKDIHMYVAFCVDASKAGTYSISIGNVLRMSKNCTPFGAILVNPQHQGQAYQLPYDAVDTAATYCVSKSVDIRLEKGRNMIYMVPFTGDQSINWSDADYIQITGDYPVTHVAPTTPVSVAANAGGYHNFTNASAQALSGAILTEAQGVTASNIARADLVKVPHVSYTVEAPVSGYYDISLNYNFSGSNVSDYAVALLVDNRPAEVKPICATGDSIADISTYLTKGVHVLTIPAILPATNAAKTLYSSTIKGLTLYNGLTLSDQFNSLATGTLLEAETYSFAWRYATTSENNGRLMVSGSQPGLKKQTYAQLVAGEKPDKNQPMLTYQIDVLTTGAYTLNVSYRDYTGSDYYMIVSVDDTEFAKAVYIGDDPTYPNRRIASASLQLTEGRHVIRLITLPGDCQASWIDVDYATFKGPCPVIGSKDWTHLQSGSATVYQGFDGTTGEYSANGEWWSYALTGYRGNSMADAAGVTTGNFSPADLSKLAYFSHRVHVPKDGYYDLQTYLRPDPNSSGTGKVLLGLEKIDVNMSNQAQGVVGLNYTGSSSGWLDLEGNYQSFSVVAKNYLPMSESVEADGQSGYSMILRVTMDNGMFYAFRILNDQTGRYIYSRYGANGSASGWDGTTNLDSAATDLINGSGAIFQVARTAANVLTVTLNGKVLDTYTMNGINAGNKVISAGFRQYGNPTGSDDQVVVPFDAVYAEPLVEIDIPGIENGSVTAQRDDYKVGDTVVLDVTPIPGYSQKLTMNGEPILLDWQTGQFSFTATGETYNIDGKFEKILWNNTSYRWVDVRLDKDAQQWWIADLSSYLTEGDYVITVSGMLDYTGGSYDQCDMGALTVSGGITVLSDGQQSPSVAYWSVLADQLAAQFTFQGLSPTDSVSFYIGSQQLSSKKLGNNQYIAYIHSAQLNQAISIVVNDVVLPETYVPQTALSDKVPETALNNVTTKLDNPNELFFRNDNLSNLPDPFVLDNTARDGYYYLYGTWGAFRCFRSQNMMDWQDCGEVLQKYRENNKIWDSAKGTYSYQALGGDLWAPEVVYDPDTGLYYMFFSATPDLKGQAVKGNTKEVLMVATSTSPAGPFNLINFKSSGSCGSGNVHTYSTGTYSDYFAPNLLFDPVQYRAFSEKINNEWRGASNGGYAACIDPHPYIAPDGTKYLFWVDSYGQDRICGVEMENWLKPKWETATVLTYYGYYTVKDWQNSSTNKVSYESNTTTNEGPFVIEHNGKYYLTYSANNWKNNSYLVAQAVSDNVLGPYTKLKESEGGIVLSGQRQGSQTSSGTGHHSILQVGDQLYMIYHRHTDPAEGGSKRNHAIDEIKWIQVNGREVMYVNGPNTTLQPKVEKYSSYHNIADEAMVTGSSNANLTYLNDGLLSHLKNGNANVTNAVGETTVTGTTTFYFHFGEARSIRSVMVYNSRLEGQAFRQIKQIKLVCLENGKLVTKYINNIAFNSEYFQTNTSGKITYVEPCSAAYAVFSELQVLSVEITMEVPSGQSAIGISEIMILGK